MTYYLQFAMLLEGKGLFWLHFYGRGLLIGSLITAKCESYNGIYGDGCC